MQAALLEVAEPPHLPTNDSDPHLSLSGSEATPRTRRPRGSSFTQDDYWITRKASKKISDLVVEGGNGTVVSSAVSLAATCIGTGLFALPYAFATAGPVFGTLILGCFTAISVLMSYLLCQCSDWAGCYAYEEIIVATFGTVGAFALEVVVVWLLLGAMTSALVVVGDVLLAAVDAAGLANQASRFGLVGADIILVALPLSWAQTPSSLKHSNTAAVLCTVIVGCMLLARGLVSGGEFSSLSELPAFSFSRQTLQIVPIIMLSLGCQVQVPSVYGDLRRRSLPRMTGALVGAGLGCFSIYVAVALFGIVAIAANNGRGQHHEHVGVVPGNVLDGFASGDPYALVMRIIMAFALTLVYPMLCLPCRSTIDHLLMCGAEGQQTVFRRAIETIFIVCVTLALSTINDNLASVFGFTGATAGALICYLLPATCYLKLWMAQPQSVKATTRLPAFLSCLSLTCIVPLTVVFHWQSWG